MHKNLNHSNVLYPESTSSQIQVSGNFCLTLGVSKEMTSVPESKARLWSTSAEYLSMGYISVMKSSAIKTLNVALEKTINFLQNK